MNTILVLEYIHKMINGSLDENDCTFMTYPTAISKALGFRIAEDDKGTAILELGAIAKPIQNGKLAVSVTSTVMTLRGEKAKGR